MSMLTNIQSLLTNTLTGSSGSSAPSLTIGSGGSRQLFAQLIAALGEQPTATQNASVSNSTGSSAATGTATPASGIASTNASASSSSAQLSQDLETFMQALRQALAFTQNSAATGSQSAQAPTTLDANPRGHHGHYGHAHSVVEASLNTLIQDASNSASAGANGSGSSLVGSTAGAVNSAASAGSGALTTLNTAFTRLLSDLEG